MNEPIRMLFTGDRLWYCHEMAAGVLRRLLVVHGDATGVDESFATAARGQRFRTQAHPADWDGLGKAAGPIRSGEMVKLGATLCLAVRRTIFASKGIRDCSLQAIRVGIPTYLISSDAAVPKRPKEDDPRLE